MSTDDAAKAAADYLNGLGDLLAEAYPRAAHGGRVEQIAQHAKNLAGLCAELPDEEVREADYEARILASYRAGTYNRFDHPSSVHERLAAALAGQEA